MSDSATGGYLTATGVPPLNDGSLIDFLHDVIAGVTGLPDTLTRPSWQRNPPPVPSIGVDWVSFGITSQRPDNAPYQGFDTNDAYNFQRHEEIDIYCIFYGDNNQTFSTALRDGMYVTQNLEQLYLANMGLVGFSDSTHIPALDNDRYFNRTDITMTLRREIQREYPILSFVSAEVVINADTGTQVLTENLVIP